jgi:hypothetical protein
VELDLDTAKTCQEKDAAPIVIKEPSSMRFIAAVGGHELEEALLDGNAPDPP